MLISDALSSDSSSSTSVIETVNGSHHFEINGYSLAKGMGAGKYISSDTFTVGGYEWAIYFYPDGKNPEDNATYVSVFIALASEGTDVRALFALTLVDQTDGKKDKVHSHFDRALECGPYSLKYRGSMWGYKRFFKRSSLENSDYLKKDCLLLKCTVGVVRSRAERSKQYSIDVPPSDLGKALKNLLDNECECDIVFQVGEETFKAHKIILAARSPIFRAQFFGLDGNPNQHRIVVEDVQPSIFKAMLFFIYSDDLPDVHEIMGSNSSCSLDIMVQQLLAAADCYDLDRLRVLCEMKLCDEITVENVATTLSLSEQHKCAQLKAACLQFIAANLNAVTQSEGFKYLEENCPSVLSELLETVASASDDTTGVSLTKKRTSSSSIFGLDLATNGAPDESLNTSGRRVRRRF